MKSKVRVAAGRKSKRKGGRVERSLVKFLKDNRVYSARRTAQCNGKSAFSESDVVAPDELPHFHIESKGTASPSLSRQELSDWFDQVYRDCKATNIPVIFHKANHKPWIALVTGDVQGLLELGGRGFGTNSFTYVPSYCGLITDEYGTAFDWQNFALTNLTLAYAYSAIYVLNGMLRYENNLRDTINRGRGDDTPVSPFQRSFISD